ncbi:MAG: GTP 3',8-cyclase MoaA [Verrucomicrobia bacterium]|nr:GTP 3',8-cyclase MoaA [Verrucomicrobiota bacterium]
MTLSARSTLANQSAKAIPIVGNAPQGVVDGYGRTINYLRISLTDMCNLRCVYCMPADMTFRPPAELMQDDELLRLLALFAGMGFNKFRYTGGEPTLRENLPRIVCHAAGLPGVTEQALTTNGLLLDQLALPLREAGLSRVNISLDTTDARKYRLMTRWGNLRDVFEGISAAEKVGLDIKLNSVIVRGANDQRDAVDMARLTLDHPWQVRFIELMPFGGIHEFQREHIVSEDELRATISAELGPMELQHEGRLDGEARLFKLRNAKGSLGFISSVTKPFCAGCNRARLTADGKLRLCLLRDKEVDLLAPMRAGGADVDLSGLIRDSIWQKPWGHGLEQNQFATNRVMSEIGG